MTASALSTDTAPETQMFTAREVPWMKLGKLVDEPVTAAEAAQLGGIDFAVVEEPVYRMTKVEGKPPRWTKIEDRKAIVREDVDQTLSIVSKDYPVVQYGEAFDFMDSISPHFVAAGGLRKFRQAFMVVRAPESIDITPFGEDAHELFATLRTSHDCSRAVEVQVMPLRGLCMNQLTLASFRKDTPHRWTVTHTGDVKSKLAAVRVTVANLEQYAKAFKDNAQRLLDIKVTFETATQVLKQVLPDRPKRDEAVERILTGWDIKDTVGYKDTGWGLVNAVSEYFEWARVGGTAESRFLAALEGQTHKYVNKTASRLLTRAA